MANQEHNLHDWFDPVTAEEMPTSMTSRWRESANMLVSCAVSGGSLEQSSNATSDEPQPDPDDIDPMGGLRPTS